MNLPNLDLELPEHGTGVRAACRAQAAQERDDPRPAGVTPTRRWMFAFTAGVTVLTVVAAGLAYVGVTTLRDSTAGRRVASLDPSEPGFEGLLATTPTLLVADEHDGVLQSAAVLSLAANDQGGAVLLLPVATKVGDRRDASTLEVTFAFAESPAVVRGAAEAVIGVGIDEVVILDDERWATLVGPVAPLTVDDDVLGAEEVAAWLRTSSRGEDELARLAPQRLFWEAWVAAIATAGHPAAVPGELDVGLGRFARALAAGPLRVEAVPVNDVTVRADTPLFEVEREALRSIITELVPFPTGTALAPRTRVRLLDGTGDPDHVANLAPTVVASDATVVVVGNASAFDYTTTEIRYHQPGQRRAAQRLRDALATGRVVEDVRPIDAFDVTIVVGTDT